MGSAIYAFLGPGSAISPRPETVHYETVPSDDENTRPSPSLHEPTPFANGAVVQRLIMGRDDQTWTNLLQQKDTNVQRAPLATGPLSLGIKRMHPQCEQVVKDFYAVPGLHQGPPATPAAPPDRLPQAAASPYHHAGLHPWQQHGPPATPAPPPDRLLQPVATPYPGMHSLQQSQATPAPPDHLLQPVATRYPGMHSLQQSQATPAPPDHLLQPVATPYQGMRQGMQAFSAHGLQAACATGQVRQLVHHFEGLAASSGLHAACPPGQGQQQGVPAPPDPGFQARGMPRQGQQQGSAADDDDDDDSVYQCLMDGSSRYGG